MAIRMLSFVLVALLVAVTYSQDARSSSVVASVYGSELAGSPTACTGERFDPSGFTAASKTLPCGTQLRVCYERCTSLRISDRGPYIDGRDLDIAKGAADAIGLEGVGKVTISQTSEKPLTKLPDTGMPHE